MNPAIITAAGSLLGRLFDRTKPIGLTNLATAGGTGIIYLGYILIQESETPLQYAGFALISVGAAVTLIKEYKK